MKSTTTLSASKRIPDLAAEGRIGSAWGALADAAAMGISFDQMADVVRNVAQQGFWERVTVETYQVHSGTETIDLKLVLTEKVVIVRFKGVGDGVSGLQ